ncbi:CAP domain-containing protein [Strongyloides ratti]|uniref:CAP domain-containing protein n=1 Tax=Strongyloides ratti TaxID=34506 RepID=A0A090MXV5_STRRB|nr:CAP domain-containing protein [Strongyloides ratti]CEF66094.1 CAP domain-containing protein [Strongyloides ratti]
MTFLLILLFNIYCIFSTSSYINNPRKTVNNFGFHQPNYLHRGIQNKDQKFIRKLKPSSFSNLVWSKIWNHCNYVCYSSSNFLKLKTKLLAEMNAYRRHNHASPLKLNQHLSTKAQQHAKAYASSRVLYKIIHMRKYGELVVVSQKNNAIQIARNWYIKGDNYNYKNSRSQNKYFDEFTQLVWKSSTNIGIGIAQKKYHLVVVCLFNPPGNKRNQYISNVLPPN